MTRPKVLVVFGTRPEVIKLAPVLPALRKAGLRVSTCATAQHRALLDSALEAFGLRPDRDLDMMRAGQAPEEVIARVLRAFPRVLEKERPDMVLVQGDTTTAFAAALCSYLRRIPAAHIEAGLRSFDFSNPYPEELNRVKIDHIADIRFAPTRLAKANLSREGIREGVFVTGNTIVDALQWAQSRPAKAPRILKEIPPAARVILATLHRRESFGKPLARMLGALKTLAGRRKDALIVFPVHPNPNVRVAARSLRRSRIRAIEPLPYFEFIGLMRRAEFLLTDSGGLQEEAAALRKPVLVAREATERPELLSAGGGRLVGTDPARIVRESCRLLDHRKLYLKMSRARNPFGDGRASRRIAAFLRWHFGLGQKPAEWAG
ncbi:MAG: UDP-N-acetylglucosamine 2-epimerase (non-hydrolyzing) [Elusimicrobia bacterium]|nr:UDP-N-acetylglucosamine 2-epimerase (non-hydrolyzing) [Elusimicrobiota bacterium]